MKDKESVMRFLESGRSYHRKELLAAFYDDSSMNEGSFQWTLGEFLKNGNLIREGYDEYRVSCGSVSTQYRPVYSDFALNLMNYLAEKFPYVQFVIFETVLMNEFLNHLIAQNTIFVQVEKEVAPFVFRLLQEGYNNVMYKPSKKEREFYWTKDSIIVTDMISEAPLFHQRPHENHPVFQEQRRMTMTEEKPKQYVFRRNA